MAKKVTSPTQGRKPKGPKKNQVRRNLLTVALLAFLIGLAFALFVGTVLWSFGYLHVGQVSCPEPKAACPATATPQVCPTCGITVVTVTPSITPSPTLTPTPDIAATATAACEAFEDQFPLTPCPPLEPTATP